MKRTATCRGAGCTRGVDWETEFCRECAVRMEEYQPRCSHCEDEGCPEDPCDICGAGHEEKS
jgi:hypothetical protein